MNTLPVIRAPLDAVQEGLHEERMLSGKMFLPDRPKDLS